MSGEKHLPASDKKIRDARDKGQVASSKDVRQVVVLVVGYGMLFALGGAYRDRLDALLKGLIQAGFSSRFHWSGEILNQAFTLFLLFTLPFIAACAIAACLSTWAQIGFLIAPEAATPSFKKMDAVSNLKNMFSKKSFLQLFLSLFKAILMAWISYLVIKGSLHDMVYSYRDGMAPLLHILVVILKKVVFITLASFSVLALLDWSLERAHLMKNLRMDHHEVKEEQKETIGNPEILKHRRQMHRSILNSSLDRMGGAKVVVANPTHISVALDYEPGKHDLPFVLAMGTDQDALLMRTKAKELGIPVVVNVELARAIWNDCEEEEYLQRKHLKLAAEVFKAVMELTTKPSE